MVKGEPRGLVARILLEPSAVSKPSMLAPNCFSLSSGARESNGLRAQSSPPPSETRRADARSHLADAYLLSSDCCPSRALGSAVISVFYVPLGGHVLGGKTHPAGVRDGALSAAGLPSRCVPPQFHHPPWAPKNMSNLLAFVRG